MLALSASLSLRPRSLAPSPAIAIAILAAAISLPGCASSQPTDTAQTTPAATHHASGTFQVTLAPEQQPDAETGPGFGRMSINKVFQGDLIATSTGAMLSVRTSTKGSAGYVAIERVTGSLDGRSGTFVLQHSGSMARGTATLTVEVVPDSGSDDLTGLSGTMTINIIDGDHFYEFVYAIQPKD